MNHDLCTSLCDAFLCLKQWLYLLKLKYSSPFCQTHINKNTRCIQNSDWTTKQLTSTWFFFPNVPKRNSMYRTIPGDQTQYLKGSFTHSCCALYTVDKSYFDGLFYWLFRDHGMVYPWVAKREVFFKNKWLTLICATVLIDTKFSSYE